MKKHTRGLGKVVTLALCLFATPALAQTAECSDGSLSRHPPLNTCSRHGGVKVWRYEELEEEANHRLNAAQELADAKLTSAYHDCYGDQTEWPVGHACHLPKAFGDVSWRKVASSTIPGEACYAVTVHVHGTIISPSRLVWSHSFVCAGDPIAGIKGRYARRR
jgi:hypothetical protein